MRIYMRNLIAGFVAVLLCTFALGLAYPAAVWGISRIKADSAEGSLLYQGECLAGSAKLQDGVSEGPYFFPRAEGMSNYGASSAVLQEEIGKRRQAIAQREGVAEGEVPSDAVTGSGSGVDPGISPAYAALQAPRVAREQGMSVAEVEELIATHTDLASLGILGQDAVNVTTLNMALPTPPPCA
ncbi:potassium-transporting ATPase subunit C [Corynebacterium sp. p3-SID1056]|uniref:potassium-transporting ATPase subunit C n=1 Tax=Corynebacterium sp. p3-SID1056 TaxID=2916092 RepID=UPI0021A41BD8|nr:potassium-transporting ATPase subunit C [Corynebacterium sp. p3-SID1056]MCT2339253.1 potassium-transporting ATPase subunit C [Corynebacterium sp. p3-SID1056]